MFEPSGMEKNCIGSQSPQRTVVLEKKKKVPGAIYLGGSALILSEWETGRVTANDVKVSRLLHPGIKS
jgi:hypothetical protein